MQHKTPNGIRNASIRKAFMAAAALALALPIASQAQYAGPSTVPAMTVKQLLDTGRTTSTPRCAASSSRTTAASTTPSPTTPAA